MVRPVLKHFGVGLHQCGVEDVEWEVAAAFCGIQLERVCGLRVVCRVEKVHSVGMLYWELVEIKVGP